LFSYFSFLPLFVVRPHLHTLPFPIYFVTFFTSSRLLRHCPFLRIVMSSFISRHPALICLHRILQTLYLSICSVLVVLTLILPNSTVLRLVVVSIPLLLLTVYYSRRFIFIFPHIRFHCMLLRSLGLVQLFRCIQQLYQT